MLLSARRLANACKGLIILSAISTCVASSFPKLSIDELVSQSEIIASGTVIRSWSDWDSEHKFIWTHTDIQVSGMLKGQANSVITVTEPGGSVDGISMRVPGATAFSTRENLQLFLFRTPLGYLRITGYGQGKLSIDAGGRVRTNKAAEPREGIDGISIQELRARVINRVVR